MAQQEESQDNEVIGIEMQELGKRVNIVEYNKQLNEARLNCNSVDTMLNVTALNNGLRGSGQDRFINSNYNYNDYDKEDNKLVKANFGTYFFILCFLFQCCIISIIIFIVFAIIFMVFYIFIQTITRIMKETES